MRLVYVAALSIGLVIAACRGGNTPPDQRMPGGRQTAKTSTLESAAAALQAKTPIDQEPGVTDNRDSSARPVPTFRFSSTPAKATGK